MMTMITERAALIERTRLGLWTTKGVARPMWTTWA